MYQSDLFYLKLNRILRNNMVDHDKIFDTWELQDIRGEKKTHVPLVGIRILALGFSIFTCVEYIRDYSDKTNINFLASIFTESEIETISNAIGMTNLTEFKSIYGESLKHTYIDDDGFVKEWKSLKFEQDAMHKTGIILYSLSHLTVWWNILACVSLIFTFVDLFIRLCTWKNAFHTKNVGIDSIHKKIIKVSFVTLTAQHPIAWTVFIGYWSSVISEIDFGQTLSTQLLLLPGYSCLSLQFDGEFGCYESFQLDLLLHLIMPILMTRQLDGCKHVHNKHSTFLVFLLSIAYLLFYIMFTLISDVSPYYQLDIKRNTQYTLFHFVVLYGILIFRERMSSKNYCMRIC